MPHLFLWTNTLVRLKNREFRAGMPTEFQLNSDRKYLLRITIIFLIIQSVTWTVFLNDCSLLEEGCKEKSRQTEWKATR